MALVLTDGLSYKTGRLVAYAQMEAILMGDVHRLL